jgi:protein-disulfide isomerase
MSQKLAMQVGPRDHASGGDHAAITLVEYGDYECSFCARAYPIVKNVRRHFGDKLRFVFRNFPLQQHPHAQVAAEFAEAAAAQGKFWETHDMLYEHQNALEVVDLLDYAMRLRLDVKRITLELEQHVYLTRIKEDVDGGARSGVGGTPAFFINGERFDADWSGPDFIAALTRHTGH